MNTILMMIISICQITDRVMVSLEQMLSLMEHLIELTEILVTLTFWVRESTHFVIMKTELLELWLWIILIGLLHSLLILSLHHQMLNSKLDIMIL
jgi:hypothetical protein